MSARHTRSLLALATSAAVLLAACSGSGATAKPSGSPDAFGGSPAAASPATGSCPTAAPPPMAAGQTRTVTVQTSAGNIVLKVEASLGPRAAANFIALATCGYYDGVIFHRLAPGFVIQGGDGQYGRTSAGDLSQAGRGGPGYQFADDPVTVPYARGTVAMANSGANTNGSQFFIMLADSDLAPNYSVFGHVTSGMDVVDRIGAMPNSGDATGNRALNPVSMTAVTVTTP